LDGIKKYYPETYYLKDNLGLKSFLEDDIPGLSRAARIEKYSLGGNILDVGCGSGGFLGSLDPERWRRYGVEISPVPGKNAQQRFGITVFVGDLRQANFPDDQFDVITLWHVFEHMPDPIEVLKQIRRILKKDGILLIAVPNFNSLESRLMKDKWYHLDVPRHLFHFTPETIEKTLRIPGFKIIKVRHFEIKNLYGFLQSSLNSLGFKKDLLRDWLSGRLTDSEKTWQQRMQMFVIFAALPLLFIAVLLLTLFENSVRMGGTIEVYAENKKA
jgi:SAM-dependent methyltransferase